MKLGGPTLMFFAQVAFTVMVVFVKIARQEMSTFEVAFWRSIVAIPLLIVMYRNISWRIQEKKIILLRILFGFGALCSFFTAAKGLYIADLSLISKVQPILVALIAPLVLGGSERASKQLWGLIGIAMIGCIILLAPSLEVGSKYGLFAILAAIFSANAHVLLRRMKSEHPGIIVMWFQTGSGILACAACLLTLGTIPIPPQHLWMPLLGIGLSATLGQLFMTLAYKRTKAATVAIASYAGPLVAVAADVIAFGQFPSWNVYVGGSIVVFAGILLIRKTQKKTSR